MRHQLGDRVQAGVCVQSGSNRLTWPQVDSSQGAETSQRWSGEIAKDLNTYVNAVIQFFLTKCVSFHLAIPQYWQQTEYINTSEYLIDYSAGSKLVLPHPLTLLLCTFSAVCDELSKKKDLCPLIVLLQQFVFCSWINLKWASRGGFTSWGYTNTCICATCAFLRENLSSSSPSPLLSTPLASCLALLHSLPAQFSVSHTSPPSSVLMPLFLSPSPFPPPTKEARSDGDCLIFTQGGTGM